MPKTDYMSKFHREWECNEMSAAVWKMELQKAIDHLAKHDAKNALACLKTAMEDCPVQSTKDLSRILFFLGITFKKLGMTNSAIKSWVVAQKIQKTKYSEKMIDRFANEYGMSKQKTSELDDWKAFYSIHAERYIRTKRSGRFGTLAERDMIRDLILEYWKELRSSGILEGKGPEEKKVLFRNVTIVFPFFVVPKRLDDPYVYVNFRKNSGKSTNDTCFCGSGLSFSVCCGRTPGEEELPNGLF